MDPNLKLSLASSEERNLCCPTILEANCLWNNRWTMRIKLKNNLNQKLRPFFFFNLHWSHTFRTKENRMYTILVDVINYDIYVKVFVIMVLDSKLNWLYVAGIKRKLTNYSSVHSHQRKLKVKIILLKEMLIAKQKHYINLYMNNNIQLIKKKKSTTSQFLSEWGKR